MTLYSMCYTQLADLQYQSIDTQLLNPR